MAARATPQAYDACCLEHYQEQQRNSTCVSWKVARKHSYTLCAASQKRDRIPKTTFFTNLPASTNWPGAWGFHKRKPQQHTGREHSLIATIKQHVHHHHPECKQKRKHCQRVTTSEARAHYTTRVPTPCRAQRSTSARGVLECGGGGGVHAMLPGSGSSQLLRPPASAHLQAVGQAPRVRARPVLPVVLVEQQGGARCWVHCREGGGVGEALEHDVTL